MTVKTPPKPVEDWFRFEAKADGGKTKKASLRIYDAIGGWFGISVSELVSELEALDADEIDVHLNSPGGDAFGGLAIGNALRRHKATVTVHVDGLAASAASVIAMAGDYVVMGQGAQMMIHDASAVAWGPAATMTKTAQVLDKLSNSYAAVYASRAGGTAKDWRKAMQSESWYDGPEAVAAGLADKAHPEPEQDALEEVEAAWDLSIYAHAGRTRSPDPVMPVRHSASLCEVRVAPGVLAHAFMADVPYDVRKANPTTSTTPVVAASPAPGDGNQPKEESMEFMDEVRQRLGADAGADEAAILAALDDLKNKPTMPEGAIAVDAEVWEATRAQVAELAEREQAREGERIVAVVDQAIRDGRTTPARRDDWVAAIKADAGSEQTLMSLAKGLLVNVEAKGFTGGVDESSDEDEQIYAKAWGPIEKKGA